MNARRESIRLIAHRLESHDRNQALGNMFAGEGRVKVQYEYPSEAEYMQIAERILDSEIVRMAEERIMDRIRGNGLRDRGT